MQQCKKCGSLSQNGKEICDRCIEEHRQNYLRKIQEREEQESSKTEYEEKNELRLTYKTFSLIIGGIAILIRLTTMNSGGTHYIPRDNPARSSSSVWQEGSLLDSVGIATGNYLGTNVSGIVRNSSGATVKAYLQITMRSDGETLFQLFNSPVEIDSNQAEIFRCRFDTTFEDTEIAVYDSTSPLLYTYYLPQLSMNNTFKLSSEQTRMFGENLIEKGTLCLSLTNVTTEPTYTYEFYLDCIGFNSLYPQFAAVHFDGTENL